MARFARSVDLPTGTNRLGAMRFRRHVLACSVAGLAFPATVVFGQGSQTVYRIGVLSQRWLQEDPDELYGWQAFVDELARRGYVEGRNVVFVKRVAPAQQPTLLEQGALELTRAHVDVIYAQGATPAAQAAKRITSKTPIVFHSSTDPVALGLVASLAQPGGNVTGSSIQSMSTLPRSIQLLAQASGKLTNLAFLHGPGTRSQPWYRQFVEVAIASGESIHCRIRFVDVDATDTDLEPLIRRLVREGVDGIYVLVGMTDAVYLRLAALLIQARLPSVGSPEAGFLLQYSYSMTVLAQTAARHVAQVLHGQRAGDIPIEQVSTFDLVINLKTAKALGLSIPTSVLVQAARLIQ